MYLIKKIKKIEINQVIFYIIVSLYCSIILNNNFWISLYQVSQQIKVNTWNITLSILMIALLTNLVCINLITYWGKISKHLSALLIIACVMTNHFCQNYGIKFDRNMLRNIFSTDLKEVYEILTINLLVDFLKFGLIPIIFIIFILKIKSIKLYQFFLRKVIILGILTVIIFSLIWVQFKSISSLIKSNPEIKYQLLPASFIISTIMVLYEDLISPTQNNEVKLTNIDPTAIRSNDRISKLPITTIIVVGETVRAQNWGISGYKRQTTPQLSKLPIINFPYANSCGTSTEVSLPCMFSHLKREQYNKIKIKPKVSVLNLLHQLDLDIVWIDNQSGCKNTCIGLKELKASNFDDGKKYCQNLNCLDEVLIEGLKTNISKENKDQVIILHQIGNHGPGYFKRYSKEFNIFTPACNTNDLMKCSNEEIVNAYDNAILYTDYVLAKIIRTIQDLNDRNFVLIYLSDHGESLGENNIYLHGMPYKIAPIYQKRVPIFFWHSKNFPLDHQCLINKSKFPVDHDNLYHTLLGIFQVKSHTYDKDYDLLSECYNSDQ